MNSRALRLSLLSLAVALPAVVHIALAHHAYLVLSLYLSSRAGNCTLAESFEGEALSRLQAANVNAARAYSRVIRTDDLYSLWSTPAGEFWSPTRNRGALLYDIAEQQRNLYGTRIRPGDIVLDAGANLGVFTRKALWEGAGKVIAIEPAAENLECLRRNFAAEIATGRVVLYPKGIWDKDEVLKMRVDATDSARDTFLGDMGHAQTVEVPLTTIDKLVLELGLPRVDFIKMDIEGAERNAIAGAKNTIAGFHPRMSLSIYHLKDDEVEVPKLVLGISPDYKVTQTCLCTMDRIQPEVAFF
jgi:FkbM family methyltransferase